MLAAMFSGRYTVCKEPEKGYVFIDRDGKHFRHILNWLRDGVAPIPNLSDLERVELLREAEYYQLLGLVDRINEVLNKKEDEQMDPDFTRGDIIKCVQHAYAVGGRVRLIGVNLSGLDLSKLHLSLPIFGVGGVDFSFACLKNVNFSGANLHLVRFQRADAENTNFHNAILTNCEFSGANLCGALLTRADLQLANLSFKPSDLTNKWASMWWRLCCFIIFKRYLIIFFIICIWAIGCRLEGANLEGANLKGVVLYNANLKGANLQRACLDNVNLENACLEGAKLDGANLHQANR
ncbi:putative chromatin remodeling & transcription regulator BTB-POZ family [Helianthus annuus]|nr:putative chromatin remodeling & transcription regulator BTB-POZ family [Helianthus annuus]KAJ0872563.1 putative chromatin remodeling & transcription regulator BTB-POZ family [Helianthus annuus]